MRKFLKASLISSFSFLTLLFPLNAFCQSNELKVTIFSENEPLPYAYILINNNVFCSTDSLGQVFISKNNIKQGDTITASYIGCISEKIIADENFLIGNELRIELKQSIELSTLRINAKDKSSKFFYDNVSAKFIGSWSDKFKGEYIIDYKNAATIFNSAGEFNVSYKLLKDGKTLDSLNISDKSVSEQEKEKIRKILLSCFNTGRYFVFFRKSGPENKNIRFIYKGETNQKKVFAVIRSRNKDDKSIDAFQALVYIDVASKNITDADIQFYYSTGAEYTLKASYKTEKNNFYPVSINMKINDKNFQINLEINNISKY